MVGGERGVGMDGHPPLAQSTFDNMGAEASALRESLVILKIVQKKVMTTWQILPRGLRRR